MGALHSVSQLPLRLDAVGPIIHPSGEYRVVGSRAWVRPTVVPSWGGILERKVLVELQEVKVPSDRPPPNPQIVQKRFQMPPPLGNRLILFQGVVDRMKLQPAVQVLDDLLHNQMLRVRCSQRVVPILLSRPRPPLGSGARRAMADVPFGISRKPVPVILPVDSVHVLRQQIAEPRRLVDDLVLS